jgi:alpha-tubulin suppressor-like RCC1 family protein
MVTVAAGGDHTCALDEQGGVWCWGNNWAGQLGDGTTDRRESATQVVGLASGVKALAAGENFTCALTEAGGVKCWGRNAEGELGNGLTEDLSIPADVVGLESGVVALATGASHACAVSESGSVLCWGSNIWGRANGNRDESDQDLLVPQTVQGLSATYVAVAAGQRHTCALSAQGALECWGAAGIPGVDRTMHGPLMVPGLERGVTAVSAGLLHTCAVLEDGSLRCWGDNDRGQLGGTIGDEDRLVSVSGLPGPVQAVSLGAGHSCAMVDSRAWCWGDNSYGQLGDGSTDDRSTPVEVLDLGDGITSLSAGYGHTCAISGGEINCWGYHLSGQLGEGDRLYADTPVEVVGLGGAARAIAAGDTHTCAVATDRGLLCWGDDLNGQLGDGRDGLRGVPVAVPDFGGSVEAVAAGDDFTCALSEAGAVKCWGTNLYGELGNGGDDESSSPVDVVGLHGPIAAIAAGRAHVCALGASGGVQCWGQNEDGQLGEGGALEESNAPVDVIGLDGGAKAIATGFYQSCTLLDSGEVRCWGAVLGPQDDATTAEPARMEGLPPDVVTLFEAEFDICAISGQGGVYCLQGGAEGFEPLELPFQAVAGAGGLSFKCLLDDRGGVWCEGQNGLGQLGDGTTESRSGFARVQGLERSVVAIAAGQQHACAVLDSGEVRCWGSNNFGQLGDGTVPRSRPVRVMQPGEAPSLGYREPSTFVPELTTYIPTPLDVSTDPAVVGTNLALAALAMLPFAAAAELLTRTLGEHPPALAGRISPIQRLSAMRLQLSGAIHRAIPHDHLREAVRFALILLFYGLVFSLLDRAWRPFTLGGLVLLAYMTIAYGVVGLADDIAQWRTARRWQIPAQFNLRASNVLLAVASTATTRLLKLVPGLMFGTPEAFEADEDRLDLQARARLARVSALALVGVAIGIWIPSALTAWLQDSGISEGAGVALGGIEAFLVLTFAVALENLFVKLLGLPGTMGETLRRRNRWLWVAALVASGFAFYHTLLNPRGELATALQEGNVRIFLGAVAAFVLVSLSLWLYFRWRERGITLDLKLPALPERSRAVPARVDGAPSVGLHSTSDQAPLVQANSAAEPALLPAVQAAAAEPAVDQLAQGGTTASDAESEPAASGADIAALPGLEEGTKKCPMCAETIKLEARTCRYCRTGFEVTVQGYCARDHALVALDARDRCCRCRGEVIDRQVKSIWLGEGSGSPITPKASVPIGREAARIAQQAPVVAEAAPVAPLPQAETPAAFPAAETRPPRRIRVSRKVILPVAGVATVALGAVLAARSLDLALQAPTAPEATPPAGLPAMDEVAGVLQPTATPRPTQTIAPTRTPAPTHAPTPLPAWVNGFADPILTAIADREPDFDYGFNPGDWGPSWLDFQGGRLRIEQGEERENISLRGRGLYDFIQILEVTFENPDVGISLNWYGSWGELYLTVTPRTSENWDWELRIPADGQSATVASGRAEGVPGLSASITLIRYRNEVAAFLNEVPLAYFNDPDLPATYYCDLRVQEKAPDAPPGVVWFDRLRMWDLRLIPDLPQ